MFPEVLTDPQIKARHNKSIERLKLGEAHVEQEVELVFARDGKAQKGWYTYIHEPYTDSSGRVIGMLAIAIDVTAEVIAKQALVQSESRFRNIVEQTPEPMIGSATIPFWMPAIGTHGKTAGSRPRGS